MKKSILTVMVVAISVFTFGNSNNFKKLMKTNLEILRDYDDNTNYVNLGDKFADIAKHNGDKIEPLYYSAYCYVISSWEITDVKEKLDVLKKAKLVIDKALSLSSNNDELIVLEAFYYQAMIMVDLQKYGQTYSANASELLAKAKAINSNNPRAEFLQAQSIYFTPAQYGGGKQRALPLFEKAAVLFKNQNTDNYLLPVWGEKTNAQMIYECSK